MSSDSAGNQNTVKQEAASVNQLLSKDLKGGRGRNNQAAKPQQEKVPSAPPSFLKRTFRAVSSMKVRYKIAGTLLIILCASVATLGFITFNRQNELLRNEIMNRAITMTHELANVGKEGLLTKQELPVVSTIEDIMKRDSVVYAMILDDEGRVFAHNDFSKKGGLLTDAADRAAAKARELYIQEVNWNADTIMDATMPIMLQTKNLKLGSARIGLSEQALTTAIRRQKNAFLWVALGFVVVGILLSFALSRMITKPLDSLAAGMQVAAKGDLRKLVQVKSNDEIGRLTSVFNEMILSLREKLLMEKYLSQSTVLNIKVHRDVSHLKLGGERKHVTALFSDARGFTAMSETLSPEDVVRIMNIYLNLQTSVIHAWGGIVDKFVGDEVMAIFEGTDMELNAVRAAMEIQNYCKSLNEARAAAGEKVINIGIGLNSGDVVMGNMGSEDHMDYTVIGDSINVAARLCGVAQPGQVLVSRSIVDEIAERASWKTLSPVTVKGKAQPIEIAEPVSIKGGARQYMRKRVDILGTFWLEGFPDELNNGMVKNISAGGCQLEVGSPVGIGSKLHVSMTLADVGPIAAHATVYHARKLGNMYYLGLCFQDLDIRLQHCITEWVHQVNTEIVEGLYL
jgi:adenylate cyclase